MEVRVFYKEIGTRRGTKKGRNGKGDGAEMGSVGIHKEIRTRGRTKIGRNRKGEFREKYGRLISVKAASLSSESPGNNHVIRELIICSSHQGWAYRAGIT